MTHSVIVKQNSSSSVTPSQTSARRFSAVTGTWQLIRLALRRDRIVLPIWILLIGVIPSSMVRVYEQLYPTITERAGLTTGIGANPSVSLLYGPAFDLSTPGGYMAWRYGVFLPLFLALACIFTVTRHTRQEEDSDRQDLLFSTVLGRYASLTAAVTVAAGASLLAGLIASMSLLGAGLPAAGSWTFGLGTALVGWVFTGITAIAVQIAEYSRTANGIGAAVLGVTFLLRAIGDSTKDISWLSWLSPLGWSTQVRSFAGEQWWVLLLLLLAAGALTAIGYVLLPQRDIGMGLLPARPGPPVGTAWLRSPFALAWRLHRSSLIGWLIGFAVIGAVFGSLADGIGAIVGDSEGTRQIFERMGGAAGLVDAFLAAITGIFGMIASLYVVQAAVRMRAEETAWRVEPLLATGVSRTRWMASHVLFMLLGSALILAVAGIGAGLLHGLRVHDLHGQLPAVLNATLVQIPAVWLVAGISVLLFGLLPNLTSASWAVASFFLLISMFGPVVNLGQAVLNISPFSHLPKLPSAEFTITPVLWLLGLTIAALVAGFIGFRRRDVGA